MVKLRKLGFILLGISIPMLVLGNHYVDQYYWLWGVIVNAYWMIPAGAFLAIGGNVLGDMIKTVAEFSTRKHY
jgi:hypothetical protein